MDDRIKGVLMMLGSMCTLALYLVLLFGGVGLLLVRVTAFAAVAMFLFVMAWVGFSLFTTPPIDADFNIGLEKDENA